MTELGPKDNLNVYRHIRLCAGPVQINAFERKMTKFYEIWYEYSAINSGHTK